MEPDLQAVSTRAELERYLEDVRFQQTASVARLARLESAVDAAASLRELGIARTRLQTAVPAAAAASALLGSASDVGGGVSSRVRDVLVVYERARAAREVADAVITLRSSIQGIYGAMEVRDWERAAQLASAARQVPHEVASSEFAAKMVPTEEIPQPPLVSLQAACDDLAQLFKREFQRASADRQMDQVTRYFKLFPLVGHNETGLQLYAQFICQIVAGLSRQLLSSADAATQANPGFYAAVLSKLFESVVSIIDQHSRVVARHYGENAMPRSVMPVVQTEIDKQAGLILDTFWDERRMETLLATTRSYSFPFLVTAFTGPTPSNAGSSSVTASGGSVNPDSNSEEDLADLQEASARLAELGTLLNRWSLYKQYIRQKWAQEFAKHDGIAAVIEKSGVSAKVSDVLGPTYSTLALFVFRRSVERAIQVNELPTKRAIEAHPQFSLEFPLVSSSVDDIMYVFSTVLGQTVDTGDLPTQLAAVAAFRRVLESDLVGSLQRRLRSSAPVSSVPSGGEFGGAGAFMVYLNDLEVAAQYVAETIAKQQVSDQLDESLTKFAESFKQKSHELLLDGCQTLAAIRTAPQAKQLVASNFRAAAYTATGQSSQQQPNQARCGARFREQWLQLIRPLRQLLHPRVLVQVLQLVLPAVAQQLERFVWSLNGLISEEGCLSLDRDVSIVIGVTTEVRYALRQKFVKLAQMVNALNDRGLPLEDLNALSNDERDRILHFKVVK